MLVLDDQAQILPSAEGGVTWPDLGNVDVASLNFTKDLDADALVVMDYVTFNFHHPNASSFMNRTEEMEGMLFDIVDVRCLALFNNTNDDAVGKMNQETEKTVQSNDRAYISPEAIEEQVHTSSATADLTHSNISNTPTYQASNISDEDGITLSSEKNDSRDDNVTISETAETSNDHGEPVVVHKDGIILFCSFMMVAGLVVAAVGTHRRLYRDTRRQRLAGHSSWEMDLPSAAGNGSLDLHDGLHPTDANHWQPLTLGPAEEGEPRRRPDTITK